MKHTPLRRGTKQLKRSPLRIKGISETAILKEEIQAVLREICIIRDKGCILRNYPEAGQCGGYRGDGELILQYDHINSRSYSVSYGDSRLGVCVCKRHHIFWKRQHPAEYEKLVRKNIGEDRYKLLERVREDRGGHKIDWKLTLLGLKQELKKAGIAHSGLKDGYN